MKRIVLLGATGSIGSQTVEIIAQHPERFQLVGIAYGSQTDVALRLVTEHDVKMVSGPMKDQGRFPEATFFDHESLDAFVNAFDEPVVVVNALVGAIGLKPTLAALNKGFDVLLANKETLVIGGALIKAALEKTTASLIPIDSEHSGIAQCLKGAHADDIEKVVITTSGGSFRDKCKDDLEHVTVADALKHPNWTMGAKITIDSATMMNKVFEIIEAHWLFGLDYDRIEAVLHRQSIVHGMVHFKDGNVLWHVGPPDMRIPILSALEGDDRLVYRSVFDITKFESLTFEPIDSDRYSLFDLGVAVAKKGGAHTTVLNAANEEAVRLFLNKTIRFTDIERIIADCLTAFDNGHDTSLKGVLKLDAEVRRYIMTRYTDGENT